MIPTQSVSCRYRFGVYEISLNRAELRKDGLKIKLQEQPFLVLAQLVENAGQTVTREQLRQRLWPADTNVDFDLSLNTALAKVRQALEESAENPRFIETVRRVGYRFLAPVELLEDSEDSPSSLPSSAFEVSPAGPSLAGKFRVPAAMAALLPSSPQRILRIALLLIAGIFLGAYLFRTSYSSPRRETGGRVVLVVLPLANLSGDPNEEFFGDGLTDELITQIGNLNPEKLGVIGRTSSMHYKGTRETIAQIGRELHANYVLEGAVRHSNGRTQVTAELIQASDQTQLWTESYESVAGDLPRMQREIAGNVAEALAVELMPRARLQGPGSSRAINEEAYETYLLGRLYWNKRSKESLRKAERLFSEAVQKDPQFELGYAGLAETYLTLTGWKIVSPGEGFTKARGAAQRALALNDSLGSAHAVLGVVSWQDERDWGRAESEFRMAISLNPANATARQWYADFLSSAGRHEEAMVEMSRAHESDPLSVSIMAATGNLRYYARQYEQAIEANKRAIEADPEFPPAYLFLSHSYLATGKYAEAVEAQLKYSEFNGEPKSDREALRRAFQQNGIRGAARWRLENFREREPREYISPFEEALLQAFLGDRSGAMDSLERAFETGDGGLVWIKVNPEMDSLRSEPRFKNLLERMHLKP